jgi:hypothetical protein
MKSELTKARDKWFESEEGQQALDPGILFSPHHAQYLRNRLELAFMAGMDAGSKFALEELMDKFNPKEN